MNPIERMLPDAIRERMLTLIVTALGVFLALQYNTAITAIITEWFPAGAGALNQIIYVVIITVVIVFASVMVEKALDGK